MAGGGGKSKTLAYAGQEERKGLTQLGNDRSAPDGSPEGGDTGVSIGGERPDSKGDVDILANRFKKKKERRELSAVGKERRPGRGKKKLWRRDARKKRDGLLHSENLGKREKAE